MRLSGLKRSETISLKQRKFLLLGNEVLYDMRTRLGRDLEADPVDAGPYARLKFAMDYWCAFWFWPIDQAAGKAATVPVWRRSVSFRNASR